MVGKVSAIGNRGRRIAPRSRWPALVVGALLLLSSPRLLQAQEDERAVRAAFVFNLTKYVSWPQGHQDHLGLCVSGGGAMGPVLKQVLEGKVTDGRRINVLLRPTEIELRDCDMLYVEESSASRIRAALDRIRSKAVLTVGDTDQFTRSGGMVALVRSGDQIEIHVNLDSVHSQRLQMSSRLLNLAVIVSGNGGVR